jgi:hypothetical protein
MKYKPVRASRSVNSAPVQAKTEAVPPIQVTPQPQQVAPSFMESYLSGMAAYSQFRG